MIFETENIELKSEFTEEIYKEIIAFANTDGGTVYVGIDDNGNAVGLDNPDKEYTRITNGIRDAIMPDVTMFVRFSIDNKKVVRITVSEGTNKPYYLRSKGLKPSGVYVRQGTSSAPASSEQIRKMIKESDGDVFEEMRSLNQQLTFESAKRAFARYNTEFNETKYSALGIKGTDGLFTNLGLILSDNCSHTIKIAVFADSSNTEFRDNKEFGGSVFSQLEDAFNYLMLCNKTAATFEGLERIESRDYPEEAVREALLNAIVHRDYSFSGSIIINVNNTETEFISIGGLVPGLSAEDIRTGISQPRNPKLAEVFHRLHLIESYGTGIRRIYKLYENCAAQPHIEVTANTFKIVLPNMNENQSAAKHKPEISERMKTVLGFISKNGAITDTEISNLLNLKKTQTYTVVKQMQQLGLISAVGKGKNKKYILK